MKLLLKGSAIPNIYNSLTDGPFRLQTVPVIERIREIFQSPSISVGVLHRGHTYLVKGFGYADQAALRVPDGNTIYCLGSCTKAFTAVALGLLVESGHLNWNTPVNEYVPEFTTTYSPEVGEKASIRDLLSHSTGLAPLLLAIIGKNAAILPRREDVVHVCSKLPSLAPLRSEWKYNNWPYALAARIIEIRSGESWQSHVHRILKTLEMDRSFTNNPDDENIAHGYKVFNDGRMTEDCLLLLNGGDAFDSSGSLRSCVHDMITWCKVLIEAMRTQPSMNDNAQASAAPTVDPVAIEASHSFTNDNILKALRTTTEPHFPLTNNPRQAYGLGLFSFHLAPEMKNSYTLGADSPPMLAIGHTGDLGSFTNAYWTFPETKSAVIVMTNASSTYGDPSNIIAQVLTQALFEMQAKIDFEELAWGVVAKAKGYWQKVVDAWSAERKGGTQPRELSAYVGTYTSIDLRMTLRIRAVEENETLLRLCINDLPDQKFELYHYHLDTWTFLPDSHDECIQLGFGYYLSRWESFDLHFERLVAGTFHGVSWLRAGTLYNFQCRRKCLLRYSIQRDCKNILDNYPVP